MSKFPLFCNLCQQYIWSGLKVGWLSGLKEGWFTRFLYCYGVKNILHRTLHNSGILLHWSNVIGLHFSINLTHRKQIGTNFALILNQPFKNLFHKIFDWNFSFFIFVFT